MIQLNSIKQWLAGGVLGIASVFLVSCSSQKRAQHPIEHRFVHGKTAKLENGIAYAPRRAPQAVIRAIAAGNALQYSPYKWGGGHAKLNDSGYDCSGAVSYVLREAGLLKGSLTSAGFKKYGKKGYGEWINIYFRKGHVFMTVAGLRLDTGGNTNHDTGPRWKPERRSQQGLYVRHPKAY